MNCLSFIRIAEDFHLPPPSSKENSNCCKTVNLFFTVHNRFQTKDNVRERGIGICATVASAATHQINSENSRKVRKHFSVLCLPLQLVVFGQTSAFCHLKFYLDRIRSHTHRHADTHTLLLHSHFPICFELLYYISNALHRNRIE